MLGVGVYGTGLAETKLMDWRVATAEINSVNMRVSANAALFIGRLSRLLFSAKIKQVPNPLMHVVNENLQQKFRDSNTATYNEVTSENEHKKRCR